jgi:hypothetical protein
MRVTISVGETQGRTRKLPCEHAEPQCGGQPGFSLSASLIEQRDSYRMSELFVTVSNAETTAKTADVRVEAQMAKWNQNLDAL